jgi:PAS domain S-box-containing protein/putative nucleotidyltransferase with HDIG domain
MTDAVVDILILEDEPAHAEAIRRAFEASDLKAVVHVAGTLGEYRMAAAATPPTIAFVDLILPDGRAIDVLTFPPDVGPFPILVMTSFGNEEIAAAAIKAGALDYIVKSPEAFISLPQVVLRALREWNTLQERKQAQQRERLARDVLGRLNQSEGTTDTIRDILQMVKKSTGVEAVGIRLREGDDFPYSQTNGFPDHFVEMERDLCARDEAGRIVRDTEGNPVLEGMCGNILRGRTDPNLSFFTEGGSFWSNCTTELLASPTEKDRQARMRNRCNGEGYESVALIPLRSGDEIIGLLQLNDHRRNQFTLEMIQFFEGLGASIGIALSRTQGEDALRVSETRYRLLIDNAQFPVVVVSAADVRVLFINEHASRMFGVPAPEAVGLHASKFWYREKDLYRFVRLIKERGIVKNFETELRTNAGARMTVILSSNLIEFAGQQANITVFQDITERKQTEDRLNETLRLLRRAVESTIQVLGMTVEARDQYLSGHQQRVTLLAEAIAREMGLPPEKLEGLRMAGLVHDIGKISIPSEILSKPSKLTPLETKLVQTHAKKGYEILKGVEFPWPLAEIVYQHHERMDGSGYPRGLKREEILVEARILAIADTVEAMASDRPYRPALGIKRALEEVAKGSGELYDADAARACLILFNEKGFSFPA